MPTVEGLGPAGAVGVAVATYHLPCQDIRGWRLGDAKSSSIGREKLRTSLLEESIRPMKEAAMTEREIRETVAHLACIVRPNSEQLKHC